MSLRILVVGAGAVGSYVGGHLVLSQADVTLIDPWPDNVDYINRRGIQLYGTTQEERHTARARALHVSDVQGLSKEAPFDVVLMCMKAYDTRWATTMVSPYLANNGFVVSVQNGINEDKIAAVVGVGRTLGCVASLICVELYEPGHVRRSVRMGRGRHTVFRVGEAAGGISERASLAASLMNHADDAKATSNLWGERWAKLAANCMRNALAAITQTISSERDRAAESRRLAIHLASETACVGTALGHELVDTYGIQAADLLEARTNRDAYDRVDGRLIEIAQRSGGGHHRASMAQDIGKGRKTEIDDLNGLVVAKGQSLGIQTPANASITEWVRRVERGDVQPGPDLLAPLYEEIPGWSESEASASPQRS